MQRSIMREGTCREIYCFVAANCAVVLSAAVTKTANAANFAFSYTDIGNASLGSVTGEVDRLPNNSGGSASRVILDSFPAALGPVCSTP